MFKQIRNRIRVFNAVVAETARHSASSWVELYLPCTTVRNPRLNINVVKSNAGVLKALNIPSIIPGLYVSQNATETFFVGNEEFFKLPEWQQDAFLAHELGHLNTETLCKAKGYALKRSLGFKKILDHEYAADAYAKEQGYRIKEALIVFRDMQCYDNRELNKRIAAL